MDKYEAKENIERKRWEVHRNGALFEFWGDMTEDDARDMVRHHSLQSILDAHLRAAHREMWGKFGPLTDGDTERLMSGWEYGRDLQEFFATPEDVPEPEEDQAFSINYE